MNKKSKATVPTTPRSFQYDEKDPLFGKNLKEKQRSIRDGFPESLGLRVHRSLSWLSRAEAFTDDLDVRFILLWIGFNSAYASPITRPDATDCRDGERGMFRDFFQILTGLDAERRIYSIIHGRFEKEIRVLLDNQHVFHPFWQHENGVPGFEDWRDKLSLGRKKINRAYVERDTLTILSILFDRLYVLRNQVMHGSSTWNSAVNRSQVRDGTSILASLLPVFIDIMMDNAQHDWPMPSYPVTN